MNKSVKTLLASLALAVMFAPGASAADLASTGGDPSTGHNTLMPVTAPAFSRPPQTTAGTGSGLALNGQLTGFGAGPLPAPGNTTPHGKLPIPPTKQSPWRLLP
jgi:hypothetical protein